MLVSYTASQIEPWLASGYEIRPGRFSYSIPGPDSTWVGYGPGDEPFKPDFAYPDQSMADAFVSAIALWDELIAPDFLEVPDRPYANGELRIAITDMDAGSAAYAYLPTGRLGKSADIWFNESQAPWDWTQGEFDFYSMIHEVGHAIGLKHSFEAPAAPLELDSQRYTVMSYTYVAEVAVNFGYQGDTFYANFPAPFPETPMVLDIAAVQAIYGADLTTRADDSTYRFTEFHPGLQTIYDAGGVDTFDLSDFTLPNKINLASGSYSSIGIADVGQQIAYWSDIYPEHADFVAHVFNEYMPSKGMTPFEFRDNVGIALSTIIENAIGGSGDDEIIGNQVDNLLKGGAGDDILYGLGGQDTLFGGDGNDTLWGDSLNSAAVPTDISEPDSTFLADPAVNTAPQVNFRPAAEAENTSSVATTTRSLFTVYKPVVASSPESETTDSAPVQQNPEVAHIDDRLDGGAGNDFLIGGPGQDVMAGGSGSDRFIFVNGDFSGSSAITADEILDFSDTDGDRIDLTGVDAVTGGNDDAFSFIGTHAFTGTAGELRYEVTADYALVTGDLDGDQLPDFAIRLDHVSMLSASSFLL